MAFQRQLSRPQRSTLGLQKRFSHELIHPSSSGRLLARASGGRSSVSGIVATVFGASGFVGRYVITALGQMGSQVVAPYRGDGLNVRHLKIMGDYGQIVLLPCDLHYEDSIRKAVSRSNVVINLIGRDYNTKNYSFHDVHVKCAYRIAKISREMGVKRFIHVSTVAHDLDSPSEWVRTKSEGENIVRDIYDDTATILRSCHIYGDEDRLLNRYAFMSNTLPILPFINYGSSLLQPIYVDDIANSIVSCLLDADTIGKTYHLGGPDVMSFHELIQIINQEILSPSNVQNLPYKIAKFYAFLLESFPKGSIFTRDLLEQMKIDFVVPDSTSKKKILKLEDLGLEPHALEETFPAVLLPYRGNREIPGVTRTYHL